jgi:hypothetical protein
LGDYVNCRTPVRGFCGLRSEKNIQQRCSGITPADINAPCDETSPTMAAVTQCVLDGHVDGVERDVKALYRDACTLLDAVGLAVAFPGAC